MLRHFLFLLLIALLPCKLFAQKNYNGEKGYIQYTILNDESNRKYDFYFTKKACLTITVASASPYDLPNFKQTTHSKEDSLAYYASMREVLVDDSIHAYRIFKSIDENIYRTLTRDDYKQYYCVNDSITSQVQWIFTSDTCRILGLKCLKAKKINDTGEKLNYWYTPEIPLPFGPGKRGNLPGLILKVESETTHSVLLATTIEIPYKGNIQIVSPKLKAKEITQRKFNKLIEAENEAQFKAIEMFNKGQQINKN